MENILTVERVTKSFLTGPEWLEVLKGIDLAVEAGEILALIGPSGVGKSTLLHIMGALDRPTSGRVLIDSEDVFAGSDRQLAEFRNLRIGFVFQSHHLMREFTALENVMMPCVIAGMSKAEASARARRLLREVRLEERADHKPGELSGGEEQRTAVARALANGPLLVLADEPSGNLDRASSEELHDLIWRLRETTGQAFVIVTHNQELYGRADRIVALKDGRAVEDSGVPHDAV